MHRPQHMLNLSLIVWEFKYNYNFLFSLNVFYFPIVFVVFYIYKPIQFNKITCKRNGKRVEPQVLKLIYGSPANAVINMTSINAGFSIISKHEIRWEELIYIYIYIYIRVFAFLEMKNNGMREKKGMRNEIVEGIFKTKQNKNI